MSRARSGYPSRSCEQDYVADEPVLGVLIVGPILVGRLRSKMSSRLKPALFVQKKWIIANNIDNKSRSRRSFIAVLSMLLLDEGGEISLWKRSGRGKSRDRGSHRCQGNVTP
jgi:hypothetical protein